MPNNNQDLIGNLNLSRPIQAQAPTKENKTIQQKHTKVGAISIIACALIVGIGAFALVHYCAPAKDLLVSSIPMLKNVLMSEISIGSWTVTAWKIAALGIVTVLVGVPMGIKICKAAQKYLKNNAKEAIKQREKVDIHKSVVNEITQVFREDEQLFEDEQLEPKNKPPKVVDLAEKFGIEELIENAGPKASETLVEQQPSPPKSEMVVNEAPAVTSEVHDRKQKSHAKPKKIKNALPRVRLTRGERKKMQRQEAAAKLDEQRKAIQQGAYVERKRVMNLVRARANEKKDFDLFKLYLKHIGTEIKKLTKDHLFFIPRLNPSKLGKYLFVYWDAFFQTAHMEYGNENDKAHFYKKVRAVRENTSRLLDKFDYWSLVGEKTGAQLKNS